MKITVKTIIIAVSLNNYIMSKTTQRGNTWEGAGICIYADTVVPFTLFAII